MRLLHVPAVCVALNIVLPSPACPQNAHPTRWCAIVIAGTVVRQRHMVRATTPRQVAHGGWEAARGAQLCRRGGRATSLFSDNDFQVNPSGNHALK